MRTLYSGYTRHLCHTHGFFFLAPCGDYCFFQAMGGDFSSYIIRRWLSVFRPKVLVVERFGADRRRASFYAVLTHVPVNS